MPIHDSRIVPAWNGFKTFVKSKPEALVGLNFTRGNHATRSPGGDDDAEPRTFAPVRKPHCEYG